MELVTHKKFKSGRLMPWGKGTVVTGAKGFVYLCGNTATAADCSWQALAAARMALALAEGSATWEVVTQAATRANPWA